MGIFEVTTVTESIKENHWLPLSIYLLVILR